MCENDESGCVGDDSKTYKLLGKFLYIGGRFEGWTYCVGCNEKRPDLLNFQSCVHRMCKACVGGKPKTSVLECPNCGESSTLREPNERELGLMTKLDQAVVRLQPFLAKIHEAAEKGNSNNDVTTNQLVKKSSSLPDCDKKNAKGETVLQLACIENNLEVVKELIASGADVNAQDNSGWTSLHEAAFYGYTEIASALLEAGAMVDVPGLLNTTPLHDAAHRDHSTVAKLLLNFGANTEARTSKGLRPIDLATTEEMRSLITSVTKLPQAQRSSLTSPPVCPVFGARSVLLVTAENNKEAKDRLKAFALKFKIKSINSYSDKVTHVVANANDGVSKISFGLLQAFLGGKTIISDTWITRCLEEEKLLDPLPFEVKGTEKFPCSLAPAKTRMNAAMKSPGLFNGCNIYLRRPPALYTDGDLALTKDEFWQLIRVGGGKVLMREPNADRETEAEALMPFHAAPDSPLTKCSFYIIQWPGDDRIRYNMAHVKTLPVEWFISSIENFKLLDSSSYF